MSTINLAPTLNWLRLQRDWFTEPGLGLACDDVGPAAAAGWPLLLVRSLLNGGRFRDRNEVVGSLRCLDIGLDMQIAAKIADAFIRHGLVLPDGNGYIITDIDRYIPADNAIPPQARRAARALREDSLGRGPGGSRGSSSDVIDGEMDGAKDGSIEQTTELAVRKRKTTTGSEGTHVPTIETTPTDVASDPQPDPMLCSHGSGWKWIGPRQSADGEHHAGYLTGNHLTAEGTWCTERPMLA